MVKPVSKSQQASNSIAKRAKKPAYDINLRGQVPDDLVSRLSALHAEAILSTRTLNSGGPDGLAKSGDGDVRHTVRPAAIIKPFLSREEPQAYMGT